MQIGFLFIFFGGGGGEATVLSVKLFLQVKLFYLRNEIKLVMFQLKLSNEKCDNSLRIKISTSFYSLCCL